MTTKTVEDFTPIRGTKAYIKYADEIYLKTKNPLFKLPTHVTLANFINSKYSKQAGVIRGKNTTPNLFTKSPDEFIKVYAEYVGEIEKQKAIKQILSGQRRADRKRD